MSILLQDRELESGRLAAEPTLESGDHLPQREFHRRYELLPKVKKAELVNGIVYMSSPVSQLHGVRVNLVGTCLGLYAVKAPGVEAGAGASVILDDENEYQPDLFLRYLPEAGGQTRPFGKYLRGAPELVVEIAHSSSAYDLHEKLEAYRKHRVREYLVWDGEKNIFLAFRLASGRFAEASLEEGMFESAVFPGLILDLASLIRGNASAAYETVRRGLQGEKFQAFAQGKKKRETRKK